MKLGITGTRDGMTEAQEKVFRKVIAGFSFPEVHHGSCEGVDIQAARIIHEICSPWKQGVWRCICHPGPEGIGDGISGVDTDRLPPLGHFARNRAIVDEIDLLIVIPRETEQQEFGGTWYTHDYAIKKSKDLMVIWPDGRIEKKAGK